MLATEGAGGDVVQVPIKVQHPLACGKRHRRGFEGNPRPAGDGENRHDTAVTTVLFIMPTQS
jgi:hypothetical protein